MRILRRYLAATLAIALSSGCSASRNPIFDWVPVGGPITGAGGMEGSIAGAGGASGMLPDPSDPGLPMAGAGGMHGDPGRPPLDQNVTFDWNETLPAGGNCREGVYVGGFICDVESALNLHIEGSMLMELIGPSESQELEVASGIINVLLDPNIRALSFNAPVTGKGDCASRNFTGEIPETMFNLEQVGLGASVFLVLACAAGNTARGTLTGRLDVDGLAVNGGISMTIGTCSCKGDFDLRAQR